MGGGEQGADVGAGGIHTDNYHPVLLLQHRHQT